MRTLRIFLIFSLFIGCVHSKDDNNQVQSINFYNTYKSDFLKSDLLKYTYDPRTGFTFKEHDLNDYYRVIIRKDSSLLVIGLNQFCHDLKINIDSVKEWDVLKKQVDLHNENDTSDSQVTYIFSKNEKTRNVREYFVNLLHLLDKYQILSIKDHPGVNVKKVIFSDRDYLIYKPDSLIFNTENKEFIGFLFKNGKELDANWVQFNDSINTDYQ